MDVDNDRRVDEARGTTGEQQQLADHHRSRIRVLHVDDTPAIVEMNRRYLEGYDERIELDGVGNAAEGMERLADDTVDCVVSDYELPGTNGLEFLEAVRQEYANLPFILYTSKPCEAIATEALSMGVTDYVQKDGGTAHLAVLANKIVTAVESCRSWRAQNRLLEAMDKLEEGIGFLDADGRYTYVNDTYAEYVDAAPEEILGKHLGYFYQRDFDGFPAANNPRRETITLRTANSSIDGQHLLVQTAHGRLVCTI